MFLTEHGSTFSLKHLREVAITSLISHILVVSDKNSAIRMCQLFPQATGSNSARVPLTTIRQKLVEYGFDRYGPYGASTEDVMASIQDTLGESILGNEARIPALSAFCPSFVSNMLIPWHKLPENLKIDSLTVDGFPEEFGGCFTQRWSDDVFRESLRNLAFFDDQGKAYLTKALACEVMKTRSACYSPTHDVDCSSETYCLERYQSWNLKELLNEDDMKAL